MLLKFRNHPEKSKNLILVSKSGRWKLFQIKRALKTLTIFISVIILVLTCLSLYTPYILSKVYRKESDTYFKKWSVSPIKLLFNQHAQVLQDNFSAFINVLFSNQPLSQSSIPSVRLRVGDNSLEALNHQIFVYGFDDRAAKLLPGPKKLRLQATFEGEDGQIYPVSFGLRGARATHHMVWKPSLRIKFKKS